MKRLDFTGAIAILLLFITCKNYETQSIRHNHNLETSKNVKHKYGIKSGIVEYKATSLDANVEQTLYFDDYGAKEVTEFIMDIAGSKIFTRDLIINNYSYTLDILTKTGTKRKLTGASGEGLDFININEDIVKKMDLKLVGKEQFAGKMCEKYTIANEAMGMKGTVWVWKGISLKSEVEISNLKTQLTVKNLLENVSIPSRLFLIPSDFTITENF